MEISYDPRYNVAYIRLRPRTGDVETLHLSDEVNVDVGPDGQVYGIELLDANAQLKTAGSAVGVVLVDEATGSRREMPFPS